MRNEQVARAYDGTAPDEWATAHYPLPFDPALPLVVEIGNYVFGAGTGWTLAIDGDVILGISTTGSGPALTAALHGEGIDDEDGIRIEENTFVCPPECIDDFELSGTTLSWKVGKHATRIRFETTTESNRVRIEGLKLTHRGVKVEVSSGVFRVDHMNRLWSGTDGMLHFLNSGRIDISSTGSIGMHASVRLLPPDWYDIERRLEGKTWQQKLQRLSDAVLDVDSWTSSGFPDEAKQLNDALESSAETPATVLGSSTAEERAQFLATIRVQIQHLSRASNAEFLIRDLVVQHGWVVTFEGGGTIPWPPSR